WFVGIKIRDSLRRLLQSFVGIKMRDSLRRLLQSLALGGGEGEKKEASAGRMPLWRDLFQVWTGLAADPIEVGRAQRRVPASGGLINAGTELGDGRTRDISIGSADDIGALDGEDRGGLVQRPGELHHGIGADDGNAGDIGPAQIYDLEVVEDHSAVGAD